MLAARGRGQSLGALVAVWALLEAGVARGEQVSPEAAPADAAESESTPGADGGDDPSEAVHSLDAIVVTGDVTDLGPRILDRLAK